MISKASKNIPREKHKEKENGSSGVVEETLDG